MNVATANVNENVRFEPDEIPPSLVTIGAGFQAAMLIVAPVVLTVVIVARIAEQPESYMSWGVFAALLVSGITTILQAVRVGRIGAGHVLIMGMSGGFHSSLRRGSGEGRSFHDGEPHRRLVDIPVPDGMGETPDIPDGREISFRLLRHYASSVRHQKYHGVDVVTVSVKGAR